MQTDGPVLYSRRDFGRLALAGVPLSLAFARGGFAATVNGVRIGVQSYSFRTMSLDEALKAMSEIGIGECELFSGHVEPRPNMGPGGPRPQTAGAPPAAGGPQGAPSGAPPAPAGAPRAGAPAQGRPAGGGRQNPEAREALRKWRLETPLDHFTAVAKKFQAAGVKLQSYNLSFNDSFTDEEIDRGFQMAKALGVPFITASATLSSAKRVAPFADRHGIVVAMHNHSNVKDPNEFATPESFAAALEMSKNFKVNLDIGHFVAAGYDPIAYIEANHARITNLHLKDRKKDQGANVPWGEGDTPIKEVLLLLKKNKYDIPANIEYEYRGEDTVAEVRKCFEFCKSALT
ncbi:MAG TPA: sugar phosphate isomerase/epimerase family protein [Vicinamibacterales bacterium]